MFFFILLSDTELINLYFIFLHPELWLINEWAINRESLHIICIFCLKLSVMLMFYIISKHNTMKICDNKHVCTHLSRLTLHEAFWKYTHPQDGRITTRLSDINMEEVNTENSTLHLKWVNKLIVTARVFVLMTVFMFLC